MSRFNPYTDNGGSTLAIAGDEFAVIAGDTRHTAGYSINTRYFPKAFHIGDNIVVSVVGFMADGDKLVRRLEQKVEWYHHQHGKPMSVQAAARLIQTMLYGKRFFPYYVHTIVAGLDENGKGAVYSFDPVGSYEREQCRAAGAAASLMMPFLDNQVNFKNQFVDGKPREVTTLPVETVLSICRDAFTSATERHIEVGDGLEFAIITKEGVKWERTELKRD